MKSQLPARVARCAACKVILNWLALLALLAVARLLRTGGRAAPALQNALSPVSARPMASW